MKVLSSTSSCNSESAFLQISNNCYAQNTAPSSSSGSTVAGQAPYPPLSPTDYTYIKNHNVYGIGTNTNNNNATVVSKGGDCYTTAVGEHHYNHHYSKDFGDRGGGEKVMNDILDYKVYPIEDNDIIWEDKVTMQTECGICINCVGTNENKYDNDSFLNTKSLIIIGLC